MKTTKTVKEYTQQQYDAVNILLEGEDLLIKRIGHSINGVKSSIKREERPLDKLLDHFYSSIFQIHRFYITALGRVTHEKFGDSSFVSQKRDSKEKTRVFTTEEYDSPNIKESKEALENLWNEYMVNEEVDQSEEENQNQELKEVI